jgi:hypothetical protein
MGDGHEHDRGMVTMFAAVIQEERDDKEDVNGEKDKKIKGLFQYMCGSYHTLPFFPVDRVLCFQPNFSLTSSDKSIDFWIPVTQFSNWQCYVTASYWPKNRLRPSQFLLDCGLVVESFPVGY